MNSPDPTAPIYRGPLSHGMNIAESQDTVCDPLQYNLMKCA